MQLPWSHAEENLSQWVLSTAIYGMPPVASAAALAQGYRDNTRLAHDEARVDSMIRWEIGKNFTAGFLTGIGGMLTLPLALPSNLGATWILQARMAAAVADLRGHRIDEPWVQSLILTSLLGAAAPEMLRRVGVQVGEWVVKQTFQRLSQATLVDINRRVGFKLLSTASGRGALSASRIVPLAGAAVGGIVDAYGCHSVARAAKKLFLPQQRLLTTG